MTPLTTPAQVLFNLSLSAAQASASADRSLGALHGISLTECIVLHRLNSAPGGQMRRVDLAQAIGRTASGVTRLLRPMEKIGLVSRGQAERDARVSLVVLSAAGLQRLEDSIVTLNSTGERLTRDLSEKHLAGLEAGLEMLLT